MDDQTDGVEQLADQLRAALARDETPPEVMATARSAWMWRHVDAELAQLVDEELATVRSQDEMLSVAAGDVSVDIEVSPAVGGGRMVLTGQVTSPVAVLEASLELAGDPAVRVPVPLDDLAGFRIETTAAVGARVVLDLADGRRVVTTWLSP
ncbi:MAG: hypothetical protein ACT4PW_06360 [Acidimicrobiia bacterium]